MNTSSYSKPVPTNASACLFGKSVIFEENHEIVFHKKHFCVIIEIRTRKDDLHDIFRITERIHLYISLYCRRTGKRLRFDAGISQQIPKRTADAGNRHPEKLASGIVRIAAQNGTDLDLDLVFSQLAEAAGIVKTDHTQFPVSFLFLLMQFQSI